MTDKSDVKHLGVCHSIGLVRHHGLDFLGLSVFPHMCPFEPVTVDKVDKETRACYTVNLWDRNREREIDKARERERESDRERKIDKARERERECGCMCMHAFAFACVCFQ